MDEISSPAAVELRPRAELGETRAPGLEGRHHFCFAGYQRPDRLEWGKLRALNLYRLAPGARREPSFHASFEIVTLVTGGTLRRLGTFAPRQALRAGAIELVSTGVGANLGLEAIGDSAATFMEIWIESDQPMMHARRQSRMILSLDAVVLAAGASASGGALELAADARLSRLTLPPGGVFTQVLGGGECAYLSVLEGRVRARAVSASTGDAIALSGPGRVSIASDGPSILLSVVTRDRDHSQMGASA